MMELERACTTGHPAYIRCSLEAAEGWLLYALVRSKRPAVVVEIGRLEGVSTQWIASALRDNGSGIVHSIDIVTKREASARLAPFVEAGTAVLHEFSSYGDEARALARELGKVNFLFVDGDHRTEAVVADVATWFPTQPDAVLFHDLGQARVRQGVEQAVRMSDWESMEFPIVRKDKSKAVMMLLRRLS